MIDISKVKEELKMKRLVAVYVPDEKAVEEVGDALYRELCKTEPCDYVYIYIGNGKTIKYNIDEKRGNLAALVLLLLGFGETYTEKMLEGAESRAVVVTSSKVSDKVMYVLVLRPRIKIRATIVSLN